MDKCERCKALSLEVRRLQDENQRYRDLAEWDENEYRGLRQQKDAEIATLKEEMEGLEGAFANHGRLLDAQDAKITLYREVLEEVARPPYKDSDYVSLLVSLANRARWALDWTMSEGVRDSEDLDDGC